MDYQDALKMRENAVMVHDKATVDAAIDLVASQLEKDYHDKNPIFLIVMTGGFAFAGKLLPKLNFPLQVDYCHATRYRGEISGGNIDWKVSPHKELSGRHVVIIDDILDEGYTLAEILENIKARKVASVTSAVLVDKNHERKATPGMRADYCELEVPDQYVFGCGMDAYDYWRNCEGIYYIQQ